MGNVDQSLLLHPPAKVNLILKIFDRLPTGYHALWSFMQTVGVTDELTIRVTDAFEEFALNVRTQPCRHRPAIWHIVPPNWCWNGQASPRGWP